MVMMTEKYGLVKITTHALDRMRKRMKISKKSLAKMMRRTLEQGTLHFDQYIVYGAICLALKRSGRFFVVATVINYDAFSARKKEVLFYE